LQEVAGSTVPPSWNKPVEAVLALQKRPAVLLVVGGMDCGKSSLCVYLLNRLVDGKCKVAVLDGDLGQSDIGTSATVGYAITAKPSTELYNLKLSNAFFVGATSPLTVMPKVIEGLAALETEILQKQVDFVIINTDGFVAGVLGVEYKVKLIKELKPDIVVCIQVADELAPLIANLEGTYVLTVEPSASLSPRTPEKRRALREMTYARYLKDAKLQNYPLSQLTVEPRKALPKEQEPDKGLLVGLCRHGKFLGIGVLREINQKRKALKVQTAVEIKPNRLLIGEVVLDEKLREVQDVPVQV
jgi:polynucleotide 5'-hydroxyl-kinase GRC3/NOL9